MMEGGGCFLIRMAGKDTLYSEEQVPLKKFKDGVVVLLWPEKARQKNLPPLRLRLIRLPGRKDRKDVWLLTNVLDAQRVTVAMASRYYRWRWENEGLFHTHKLTLSKT